MAWFMRGVQSVVFHYASCAPCTGYSDGRKRRKTAKAARKLREKLEIEQPEEYHHPEPTGTNVYWNEEITLGPGPPPRKARRATTANTGSSRGLKTRGTQSPPMSKGGSSSDVERGGQVRLSDETLEDDETWNHKRYQREDEDLWGHDEPPMHLEHTITGSSVGGAGYQIRRPGTSRSGSYYTARAPPVNELHPPVVSLPSPDPSENRWMLQPPPKASVMAGKERASNRSRSGSGASSRVELSLGRQVSTRQLMYKLERGQTPEGSSTSPNGSYFNLTPAQSQRRDRCRTPQTRPPSATSSSYRKRRDTTMSHNHAMMRTESASTQHSSGGSSDTITRGTTPIPGTAAIPDIKIARVRQSRPVLSTVLSSNSGTNRSDENVLRLPEKPRAAHHRYTTSSAALKSTDMASLSCLEDLVSPQALLQSRFVSAPLVEAKIRLPPSEEDVTKESKKWEDEDEEVEEIVRVPFDRDFGPSEKDPRFRWSVDF
ncbi:hypothetical protein A1F94_011189 [Pyrenophora tritici-repentis]|uniref:Uncharacterized protein n=2 Tax=Pyrenophora tritici-repentis TaxID=45151 RepID=A0A2W1GE72_9PLEO|nr:hypothetical protein PtrV1_03166 [Pyrenophora tritici-repentis]KAF7579144.1 hypothetical protein PtrM4_033840 [Pyrenophora tritici-repentis]KAG9378073.1 hypothetical protein A1F94_011189 [Pyrenophora tritici-repentis]KAI0587511.1 hypothetical protein Alg215_01336 [Pyrenophora tritici-repentis]KAI1513013.1 hypothetical protein Ptr86124_008033 [Pyrenophora tritici-repentis]